MINGIPMKLDYSKTLNDQHETFEYYKNRYINYELQIIQLNKRIAYLERSINRKENEILDLRNENVEVENCFCNRTDCGSRIKDSKKYDSLQQENEKLKKQLEYLRSGEYYNQLRFENEMLQQVVDTNGVPSEVYDFLESVHKNTEFLEQQQEFIKYLEDINSFETIGNILSKYKEIIGADTNVGSKGGNEDENNSI